MMGQFYFSLLIDTKPFVQGLFDFLCKTMSFPENMSPHNRSLLSARSRSISPERESSFPRPPHRTSSILAPIDYRWKRRNLNSHPFSSKYRNDSREHDQEDFTTYKPTHMTRCKDPTSVGKNIKGRQLFISNVPSLFTAEKIEAFFAAFGHVERVKIQFNGGERNSAIVTFQQEADARMASKSTDAIMGDPSIKLNPPLRESREQAIDSLIQKQKDIIKKLEDPKFDISEEERKALFQSLRSVQDNLRPLLSASQPCRPAFEHKDTLTPANKISRPQNIDNRPRTLHVQMSSSTDIDFVRSVFGKYGQIDEISSDANSEQTFFVKYSRRFEAENVGIVF